LEELIIGRLSHPHALLSAVCLARLNDSGPDLREMGSDHPHEPFLNYVYESSFIHAQQSRDDPLTRARLGEVAQSCHSFPIQLQLPRFSLGYPVPPLDTLLGPLHLLAYFNLPIALAGSDQLRNPNKVTGASKLTALCLACGRGSNIAVKELLELPAILINEPGMFWMTPLMWAAGCGKAGAVSMLLARSDIEVNAFDDEGFTALDRASDNGHVSAAKILISHPDIAVKAPPASGLNTIALRFCGSWGGPQRDCCSPSGPP
jgi:Ankyrin repeats (3 copies)